MRDAPTVFVHWERFLGWLLDHTEKFPKRLRFTLTNRIDNLALDVFEQLVVARYSRDRQPVLERVNLELETLRLLLRVAHERRALDTGAFTHACEEIDAAGRMVGGWIRHQRAQA